MKTSTPTSSAGLSALIVALAMILFGQAVSIRADENHEPVPKYPTIDPNKAPALAEKRSVPEGIQALHDQRNKSAPMDEALGGITVRGTPVAFRTEECFPAEPRDLFWQMDQVATGDQGKLEPLNFDRDGDGVISNSERDAIRGRNTWVLWGGGNESFWGWLTEDGYGLNDFMIMIDSRKRLQRFQQMGAMNQPGFLPNTDPKKRLLGLYLDVAHGGQQVLQAPPQEAGLSRPASPTDPTHQDSVRLPSTFSSYVEKIVAEQSALFQAGDVELFQDTVRKLAANGDGVDYNVYGFPSGIIGLRLFLNPDFFGVGAAPQKARQYWKERVIDTNDRYYTDPSINADRHLVRPFRISMSCGYCHVGPHPLNPPKNVNEPKWENLSNAIGNQYWQAQPSIGNLPKADSILHHFLSSQEPGTVDTSGFSPDQLNNANTINGIFQINPRVHRAQLNPKEVQSIDNLRIKNIEEGLPALLNATVPEERRTARVLLDGSDSIGAFAALARVYLNIGTFSQYWNTRTNPLLGFTKHKIFDLKTCQSNSVYWRTNEKYRANYLAAFFTYQRAATEKKPDDKSNRSHAAQSATTPMKLRHAKLKTGMTPTAIEHGTAAQRIDGRKVWMNNCAICHSSKQPDGFDLKFSRKPEWAGDGTVDWTSAPEPKEDSAAYTLPMDGTHWTAFKNSKPYRNYLTKLRALVQTEGKSANLDMDDPWEIEHGFWTDNYLSTDIRVPITLVGTNAARGLGTNAVRGNVWDNLSSDTYKALPPIGTINCYNPFNGTTLPFNPPGGGVGYYRPNTHVALWATAPFLHNNTLGYYTEDPSVEGRLIAFEDGMRRMLWQDKRADPKLQLISAPESEKQKYADVRYRRAGDLRRDDNTGPAAGDTGYIYRLPNDAKVHFAPSFVRPLIQGVAGPFITSALACWGWLIVLVALLWVFGRFRVRHAGILLLVLAGLSILVLTSTGMTGGGTTIGALLAALTTLLEWSSWTWFVLCTVLTLLAVLLLFAPESERSDSATPDQPKLARTVIVIVLTGVLVSMLGAHAATQSILIVLALGALLAWRWRYGLTTLLRKAIILPLIVATMLGGYVANRFINGEKLAHIPFLNKDIGPWPVEVGPFPRGMPLNLVLNADPDSKNLGRGLASMFVAIAKIKTEGLQGEAAYEVIKEEAGTAMLEASKCPDLVLDRGHLFGEELTDDQGRKLSAEENNKAKEDLIAFLKTL